MPPFQDLSSQTFGRWTVLHRATDTRPGAARWLCRCECGKKKDVPAKSLKEGSSKSCGCFNIEVRRRVGKEQIKHGMTGTKAHNLWTNMKQRCENPNATGYSTYGAKGVRVCERWRSSFENFLADMGPPLVGQTIDRIDSRGNYEPGNCRWASMKVQQNNRTNNRHITYGGRTMTLQQWSDETGMDHKTIDRRLELGWSVERALTTPPVRGRNQYSPR